VRRGPLGIISNSVNARVGGRTEGARVAGAVLAAALIAGTGCERNTEAARALIAERRASWAREIAGIKEQHAALAARLGARGAGAIDRPADQRMHAVLDGARQSIVDVESQLSQAQTRMEQAIRRGGEAGQRAIDEESVKARGYMQALGEQLVTAAKQLDDLSKSEDKTQQPSP